MGSSTGHVGMLTRSQGTGTVGSHPSVACQGLPHGTMRVPMAGLELWDVIQGTCTSRLAPHWDLVQAA